MEKFEAVFAKMEIRVFPAPTEIALAMAGLLRSPLGLLAAMACVLALVVPAWLGAFDRGLGAMTIATVVGVFVLAAVMLWAVYLPFTKVQQSLVP